MPTNVYTSQTIASYNTSPPSDDGAKTSANQITWDKHKSKLADPIKTLAEAINSEVLAAFAKTINTDSSEINAISGSLAFPNASLTATSGTILPVRTNHRITMTNAATTVQTIVPTSVTEGTILELRSATDKAVTLQHATTTATAGEIFLRTRGDTLLSEIHPLMLQNNSGSWYEIPKDFGLINSSFTRVTGTGTATSVIPVDDTVPLATEGLRMVNVSYTPRVPGSQMEIVAKMLVGATGATGQLSAAMFIGTGTATAGTSAITAGSVTMTNAGVGSLKRLDLTYPHTTTSTDALNIEINCGPSADTLYFGGMATTALFGASRDAWLIVKESI